MSKQRDKLETVTQVAERLAVSVAAVRKWIFLKKLNPIKVGRSVRLRAADVDEIVKGGLNTTRLSRNAKNGAGNE